MPSEKPPARLAATDSSPTRPMTSSTRRFGIPFVAASASRWLRAERPVWIALRFQQGADLAQRRLQLGVLAAVDA